jgi:hypothetical protein
MNRIKETNILKIKDFVTWPYLVMVEITILEKTQQNSLSHIDELPASHFGRFAPGHISWYVGLRKVKMNWFQSQSENEGENSCPRRESNTVAQSVGSHFIGFTARSF